MSIWAVCIQIVKIDRKKRHLDGDVRCSAASGGYGGEGGKTGGLGGWTGDHGHPSFVPRPPSLAAQPALPT